MINKAMERKLKACEALDVGQEGEQLGADEWRLKRFVDGVDYCDAKSERWIWSIGKHRVTGEIIAATGTLYYGHRDYECLFLR